MLRDVPLDLEDMFTFSHSPVDMGKPWLLRALIKVGKLLFGRASQY